MKNQYEIDYQQGYDKANEEWSERIDKIRAEIKRYQSDYDVHGTEYDRTAWTAFNRCLQILDKNKADTENT